MTDPILDDVNKQIIELLQRDGRMSYAALAKVVGLSEALNRELASRGIGVSVLCPMIVETNINANSLRNRPQTLRNPDHTDQPPDIEAGSMVGSVIPPDEVGRRVVRAIDRNDLYVLTHPEQRGILSRRARKQDKMFEPDVW